MQIDWFTLVAQIINFLILVGLLMRFLYRPIIRAMDEREERIAARVKDAEAREQEAEDQTRSYREQRRELDNQTQQLLDEAETRAEEHRQQLMARARGEVEQTQATWREAIAREQASFLEELRTRAGDEVCAVAARTLKDLANRELQEHMIEVFLGQIEHLADADRRELTAAIAESGNRVVVTSAFDISADSRDKIARAIRERLVSDGDVQFQIARDLICGIELKSGGRKISWNVAGYLDALQARLSQVLAQEAEGAGGE